MRNTARNHHYVPQFYLKGFPDPNLQNEQLLVIDKVDRRHFVTIPRNIASQRDFNRINLPDHSLDKAVLPLFSTMDWSLVIAEEGETDFICSDLPAVLFRVVNTILPAPYETHSMGYTTESLELTMPLTRTLQRRL